MKKTITLIWLFFFSIPLFSYTWIPFCPDSIHANNICFGVGSWKGTICSPEGLYLWEDDSMEWNFYSYSGLPVTGAAYLDAENILVAMGEGTYSDGVYSFNLQTHEFEVIKWLVNPNFLLHDYANGYFIGCQFGGLWKSEDGLDWDSIPYFIGKSCTAMDTYSDHFVVTEVSNIYNVYTSDDSGNSWQEAVAGSPMITDLKFSFDGDLYGIFPDYSNSSGLWSSSDWGNSWEVEFWSDNMSAIGFDAMSIPFVGWESPTSTNEGIAIYTPNSPPPNLSPLNNGLPNLNINKILMNPTMSAIAIFCCTDAGVYVCYDYMVGVDEFNQNEESVKVFPNPVDKTGKIRIRTTSNTSIEEVAIFSNSGHIISAFEWDHNKPEFRMDIGELNLNSGIYFIQVKTNKKDIKKKLIIY